MLNTNDILETISMIEQEHLDIRTVTIGISLLDCIDPDIHAACNKIYDKICRVESTTSPSARALKRNTAFRSFTSA